MLFLTLSHIMKLNSSGIIKNLIAGLTVSFAAISLGAAFGVMSGRGAMAGMIGAAVIPIITSIIGGTRLQASGPTAPMTAVTALIVAKAYELIPDATLAAQFITLTILMSSVIMFLMALLRTGNLIKFVPNAVVLGFMNGIALLIWFDQVVHLFGLNGKPQLDGGLLVNLLLVLGTLVLIYGIPGITKRTKMKEQVKLFLSPVLLAILIVTFGTFFSGIEVQSVEMGVSIGSATEFFSFIASCVPKSEILTSHFMWMALPLAFQLAMLGYLDSLLTSLVIDRMTGEKTRRNKELFAQGISNAASGLLQGLPGAQATIRSVLLLKEGADSRLAGVFVGIFALIFILFFGHWITLIPSAVFIAILLKAGWDVTDRDYTRAYFRGKWWTSYKRNFQVLIIALTMVITVVVDLNTAVISGTILFFGVTFLFKKYGFIDVEHQLEESID